jgi:hypothetical protein
MTIIASALSQPVTNGLRHLCLLLFTQTPCVRRCASDTTDRYRAVLLTLPFLLISRPPSSVKSSGTTGSKRAETNQGGFHMQEHVARMTETKKRHFSKKTRRRSLFGRHWHKLGYSSNIYQQEGVRTWIGHIWQRVGCSASFSSTCT